MTELAPVLHPMADALSWARVVFGAGLVLALPGFWVLGRFCRTSWPVRAVLSLAAGVLLAAGTGQLAGHTGLPFVPWTHLLCAGLLGLGLGFVPGYRSALAELVPPEVSLSRAQWWLVGTACAAMAATVVHLLAEFPVPPSRHDAGNHAFMVLRMVETGSTAPTEVFGYPWGLPQRPYFMGWHAAAALVARSGGLPPWVGIWLFSHGLLMVLPAALVVVWRGFRVPAAAAVLAAWLLPVCGNIVVAIPRDGGMGQLVALFCLVLPLMALVRAVLQGRPGLGAVAGVSLACLLYVHASWTLVTLLLAAAWLLRLRQDEAGAGRRGGLALAVALGVCAALIFWDVLPSARVYRSRALNPEALIPLAESLRQVARGVGTWWLLEVVTVAALVVGLVRRETRPLAVLAALFAVLSVTVASFQDPVSMALSEPWYQIWFRLLRPQVLLLPPLVGSLVWWGLTRVPAAWRDRLAGWRMGLAAAVILAALILPAGDNLDRQSIREHTYFTDDDARLAARIADEVPAGKFVANWRNDGTCWLMHLSGRTFLSGANWVLGEEEGRNHLPAIKALVQGTSHPGVAGLREMGVTHLVATTHWPFPEQLPVLRRNLLARSPFVTIVAEGEFTTLYSIKWRGGRADRTGRR